MPTFKSRLSIDPRWPFWVKGTPSGGFRGAAQIGYRFRNDDGNQTTATWRQPANTTDYLLTDTTFRLRFEIEDQSVSGPRTVSGQLEVSTDNLTWSNVTTSSSVVKAVSTANVTDNTATTDQLAGSAKTFQAGSFSGDGLASSIVLGGTQTEIEYALRINSASVVDQQPLWFRIAGLTAYTVVAQATVSEAVIPFTDTFDSGTAADFVPTGWVLENSPGVGTTLQNWFVKDAPSWGTGRAVWAATKAASDLYLTRAFSNTAGNGATIRLLAGTDQSPVGTTRNGTYFFYSGTTLAFAIIFFSDDKIYLNNMSGGAATVIFTGYAANTLYDIKVKLGAAGAITSANVNGTVTNTPGTMNNSVVAVNTIRADNYNGGLGAVGHAIFDAITIDTSTVIPNGTLAGSGTLDGTTLGADTYGGVALGYTNGASPASGIYKVERSANGGTTYATINAGRTQTASGWLITDARPQYGGQPVTAGNTATYRVTAINATGNQATVTTSATVAAASTTSIDTARFAMLHGLISAQPGGFYPTDAAGEAYPATWMLAMAYAYAKTGDANHLADTQNEFNYLVVQTDSNGLVLYAPDTSVIYRDHHLRRVLTCALAARILRGAGQTALAATIIAQCDTWMNGWLLLNSGSPYLSTQVNGWDASNSATAPAFVGSAPYYAGQRVTPPAPNGHVYEAQSNGMGSGGGPVWPTGSGSTVTDLDITWKEVLSYTIRANTTAYAVGDMVVPSGVNGLTYRCIVAGTSAGSPPTWPTGNQSTVTDGGVTWRCTSTNVPISFATYTNDGTTYPAIGTADVDLNQVMEEGVAWALLTTDSDSAFSVAGAAKTAAQLRITVTTTLMQANQASGGRVSIGQTSFLTDGRAMYDTLYGAYTAQLAAITWHLDPASCHADTGLFLAKALDWFDASYSSEPLKIVHYTGTQFGLQSAEIDQRRTAYDYMARTNPLQGLWYSGAFNFAGSAKWGYYIDSGPPMAPTSGDPWQARMLIADAIALAIPASTAYSRALSATVNLTTSFVRLTGKPLTAATVTATASVLKQAGKLLTASTVTATATLAAQKVILKALSATVNLTASLAKQVGKPVTASTVVLSASLARQANKALTASTVAVTATLATLKVILRTLTAATVSITPSLVKQINKPLRASTVSLTPSLIKQINKPLTAATITVTASLTVLKVILRTLTASTVSVSASLVRQVGKPLVATTVTLSTTLVKQVNKALIRAVTIIPTLAAVRVVIRTLTATR
jgi:hypothetical protein